MKTRLLRTLPLVPLLLAFEAYAMESAKPMPPTPDTAVVERGGALSRLAHRGALRVYSEQIRTRTVSLDGLSDYLAKGGDPTTLSGHRLYDDFRKPLLNQFIAGRSFTDPDSSGRPYEADTRRDRARMLALLLDNGAAPDAVPAGIPMLEDTAPLLFASWLGDLEAMRLLIAHGADVDRMQRISTGNAPWGPPLLLVPSDAAADLLLRHGADTGHVSEDGRNLVQVLVTSRHYDGHAPHVLARLRWFQARGLRFTWRDGGSDDPLRRARALRDAYAEHFPYVENPQDRAQVWAQIVEVLQGLRV